VKLKSQELIAVDVLFKAYPMVPLSCRPIWPDGTFQLTFATLVSFPWNFFISREAGTAERRYEKER
jgi:hypothetical protein